MSKPEPVFARQEQAVVYLFARYWEHIEAFEGKTICDMQAHFPDASLIDETTGDLEAVEFEYAISSFRHHDDPTARETLTDWNYKSLHIVYWEEDADKETLRNDIKDQGVTARVQFVCLSKYFSPLVK
jgi:hypothetical protein